MNSIFTQLVYGSIALVGLTQSATLPIDGSTLQPRQNANANANATLQGVNCNDPSTGRDTKCFAELGLERYINEWVANHECYQSEGFTDCFERMNGYAGQQCQILKLNSCPAPNNIPAAGVQAWYVLYNIASLRDYFLQYYLGATKGVDSFDNIMSQLSKLIDPVVSTKLSLITKDQYQNSIEGLQAQINTTAVGILSNHTEFISYTRSGRFSNFRGDLNNLPDLQKYFHTDLVAKSLNSSGIYLTVGRDTNPFNLTTNGTKLAYPISCGTSRNDSALCDAWWYSQTYKSSFGLASTSQPQKNLGELTANLFSPFKFTGATTGEALFDGAYACSANGTASSNIINLRISPEKLIDFTCVASTLPVYTWDMVCHSTDKAGQDPVPDSNCEFLERPKKQGFWDKKGSARAVPPAYLGPALTQGKLQITRQ